MRPTLTFSFIAVVAAACSSTPAFEFEVQAPESQGMDSAILDGARAYAFQPEKNTQGVVVTRRGVIVAEWYEQGADAESYAASWSMAKSFTSALVGLAIDEGSIDRMWRRVRITIRR